MSEIDFNFSRAAFPGAPVRSEDLQCIVDWIRQGQCCAVVGVSNTGKSFLLKSLLSEEVRQACTCNGSSVPIVVFVDCLQAGDNELAFYVLLLRCLLENLETSPTSQSTIERLRTCYFEALHSTADVGVRDMFASSMHELERQKNIQLVLILDEFDDIFRSLSMIAVRQFRALRDEWGTRLCYVVATSRDLESLRPDAETYEFREPFHLRTRILRPLSTADSERFIAYLAEGRGRTLEETYTARIIELSGGHPGIMERAYSLLEAIPSGSTALQTVVAELGERQPIKKECQRLWEELEEKDQQDLLTLVRWNKIDADSKQRLVAKGLVIEREDGTMAIFSPVFEAFVRQEWDRRQQTGRRGLWYDENTRQVGVDDRDLTRELSGNQYALVVLLCQRPGIVCTKDEIARAVWPDQCAEGITDAQISELVRRIRAKIEPDPSTPRYIETVRGQGYRLKKTE